MEVPRGFTRCDECEGSGALGGCGSPTCDHAHTFMFCPSCSGSGLSPTEKQRLRKALQAQRLEPPSPNWRTIFEAAHTHLDCDPIPRGFTHRGSDLVPTTQLRHEAWMAVIDAYKTGGSFAAQADAVLAKVVQHIKEDR